MQAPGSVGCNAAVEGKTRCVKVGDHNLPGLPSFDLTAKVRCKGQGGTGSESFSAQIESAEACELTEEWVD